MSEYIGCRSCSSPSCKGCNMYNLEAMLEKGAFDGLMDGNRCIHPVADVVEVKHGRCDYCKDGTSFIGAKLLLGNDGKWHRIEHCPNCGAKMDGGADNG